ncbi:hypothetical protein Pint_01870 [Pistacia integerrima]|uniref:Uncharacterized protein n=1 Tax=Pistacia integerrima TaxID=434235 RepID=A0ACC0ZKW3_9ROSI|nr:hypothetical protein Pint_01870 [Pistacia integerrima]
MGLSSSSTCLMEPPTLYIAHVHITFLMPNDDKLSESPLRSDLLHQFILRHSIPTPLVYNNMLHFPNGTLVPSSLPGRMLSITNSGKSGMFVNNAKIVTSNVCVNSLIKCHGIRSLFL